MTTRRVHVIAALVFGTALGGCATGARFDGPQAVPPDRAQLYVYRTASMVGLANSHKIAIDSKPETLSLPALSWQRAVLYPGPHDVTIKDFFGLTQCGTLRLELAPGQTAYVENIVGTINSAGVPVVGCWMAHRTPDEALKAMTDLRAAQ